VFPPRIVALLLSIALHALLLIGVRISRVDSSQQTHAVVVLQPERSEVREEPAEKQPESRSVPPPSSEQAEEPVPLTEERPPDSSPPAPTHSHSPTPTATVTAEPTQTLQKVLAQLPTVTPSLSASPFPSATPEHLEQVASEAISNTAIRAMETTAAKFLLDAKRTEIISSDMKDFSEDAAKTKLETDQIDQSDSRQSGSSGQYRRTIMESLQSARKYPGLARRRGIEGTVIVSFTIAEDGSMLEISIDKSSGHRILDHATLDVLREAFPMPPPPLGEERFRLTFRYALEE
jgi:protein TonB